MDERLKTLEDSNDVLSVDVGKMSTKVEELEKENQFIKEKLRNLEEKLDSAENHSKRNNLLFYGIPTAVGETWSDSEDKVMNIIKTDMKITEGVAIERAHRVGKAIIIKLQSYKDKEKILKGAKNLASTNKSHSRRHTGRDGRQVNTPSTRTEHRQWSRVLRSEVRQQYTPASKSRAGVRDHGSADADG